MQHTVSCSYTILGNSEVSLSAKNLCAEKQKEIVELDFKVQNLERDKEEKVSFIIRGSLSKAHTNECS